MSGYASADGLTPMRDPEIPTDVATRMVTGGAFILDAPENVPAVWGDGPDVLWAEGESAVLAGPPGVGKTTIAGQLVRARIMGGRVLGYTVAPTRSRVLYLAMDRPRQIARALRRTLGDIPREILDAKLIVWPGPPVADIAKHPETLIGYATLAGADTIIVDSLKDAAVGLIADEVGAGYNRARQMCTANGVEVLELHHMVKNGANGATPNNLAGLYGSVWLSAGAGSVVLLWGAAGDPIVTMTQLKTPCDEVGPFQIIHDHTAGTSAIWHATDLLIVARSAGAQGITAKEAARVLFSTDSPDASDVEKARRKLDALAKSGRLVRTEGDRATARPARWTFTDTFTGGSGAVDLHDLSEPSRTVPVEHGQTFTPTFTTITDPDLHVSPPLFKGGEREGDPFADNIQELGGKCGTCHQFICACEGRSA